MLDRVRQDIQTRSFESDDVRMRTYNSLLRAACELFPEDDILNEMVALPDETLQNFGWQYLMKYPDVTSRRLEEHLTALVNRLTTLAENERLEEDEMNSTGGRFYAKGSPLHALSISLDKIKKLSESDLVSEKLLAFNTILFVLSAGIIISHLWINGDNLLSLTGFLVVLVSLCVSFIVSILYTKLLEVLVNLQVDKIGSLRVSSIVLLIGLPVASAGLFFNELLLTKIAIGIIVLQFMALLLGTLISFSREKIPDKKVEARSFREVIGDFAGILTIINFPLNIILFVIAVVK